MTSKPLSGGESIHLRLFLLYQRLHLNIHATCDKQNWLIRERLASHYHWDHQGDLDQFPPTTDLIVGPGFRKAFIPAYPEGAESPILQNSLE